MDVASTTETGHVRRRNEDAVLVATEERVFAVADGLGGHPAGDVASGVAIERLRDDLAGGALDGDPARALVDALHAAHERVVTSAREDPSRRGMGTTAVVAHVRPDEGRAWIAHVGDSRAYLLRDGRLRQVTTDHAANGRITQALGVSTDIRPDVVELEVVTGDRLLLCTDGLTDMVVDEEIEAIAAQTDPPTACDGLVDAAMSNGGVDNVTIVLVEI